MANIKFLLRDLESENEQTIYVTSRFGRNEKLMYATPLKIESLFWDEKERTGKNSKYCTNKDEINAALTSINSKINLFVADAATKGNPITKIS